MRICPYCGQQQADHFQYCTKCGKKLPDIYRKPEPEEPRKSESEELRRVEPQEEAKPSAPLQAAPAAPQQPEPPKPQRALKQTPRRLATHLSGEWVADCQKLILAHWRIKARVP